MIWGGTLAGRINADWKRVVKEKKRVQRVCDYRAEEASWQIPDDVRSRCGVADLTRQNAGRSVGVCVDANAGISDAWEMLDLDIEAAKVSDMQCRRCDVTSTACRCSRLYSSV